MLKNLPEGEFTIEVSFVGFKTVTKKVTTGKGKTQELNFELDADLRVTTVLAIVFDPDARLENQPLC